MSGTPTTLTASPPFDSEYADLILRSSDNVDFKVFKGILILTSGYLKEQIIARSDSSPIHLPYSSETIDTLLRIIYPLRVRPVITDFTEMRRLTEASIGLDIDLSTEYLRNRACDYFSSLDPMGVYALAVSLGWDDTAQAAASAACDATELDFDSIELEHIPASAYLTFLRYVKSQGATPLDMAINHITLRENTLIPVSQMSLDDNIAPQSQYCVPAPFDCDQPVGNVRLKSSDGFVFNVQKAILSLSSPFFADMFALPQSSDAPDADCITLDENAKTIEALLRYLYPISEPEIPDIGLLRALLRAGSKYDLERVISRAKQIALSTFIPEMPLRVYAIACLPEILMENLAAAAARGVLAHHFENLNAPELCEIEASSYRRLECYVNACRLVIPRVLKPSVEYSGPYTLGWLSPSQIETCLSRSAGLYCICSKGNIIAANSSQLAVPNWFLRYLRTVENVLKERPADVKGATMPIAAMLVGNSSGSYRSCECLRDIVAPPDQFNKALAAEIDHHLAAVKL